MVGPWTCCMWMLGSPGSQAQWDPVVLPPSAHGCTPSMQAKDSDDDDDVTVTVDRDRFMDEFFEQVGAAHPPLPKHQQTWDGHVSPPSQAWGSRPLCLAQQLTGAH